MKIKLNGIGEVDFRMGDKLYFEHPYTMYNYRFDKLQRYEIGDELVIDKLTMTSIINGYEVEIKFKDTISITISTNMDMDMLHIFNYIPLLNYLNFKHITRRTTLEQILENNK